MGELVIAAYRPKSGREAELLDLLRDHTPHLRRLGLATERASTLMRAKDGTLVEVFEWKDGAVAAAHEHPDVLALWSRYAEVCDYTPLTELAETHDLFAMFEPVSPTP